MYFGATFSSKKYVLICLFICKGRYILEKHNAFKIALFVIIMRKLSFATFFLLTFLAGTIYMMGYIVPYMPTHSQSQFVM